MLFMNIRDKELQIAYYDTIKQIESYNNIHGLFYKICADNWVSKEFLEKAHNTALNNVTLRTVKELMWWREIHVDKHICNVCLKKMSCMLDGKFDVNNAETYVKCKVPSIKGKEAHIDKPLVTIPLIRTDNGITGIMLKDYTSALIKIADNRLENVLFWEHIPNATNTHTDNRDLAQSIKLLLHMHWQSLYKSQYHPRKDVLYLRNISSVIPIVAPGYKPRKVSILPRYVYYISDYKIFE